jgi:inner membrane protein
MDLFTHFLIPFIILFFIGCKWPTEGGLGGISVDFDFILVFIGFLLPEFFILTHRGITHSFIFGFITAVIFLYIVTRQPVQEFVRNLIKRDFNIIFSWKTVLLAYFGVLIHLFLDFLTTGGIPLLYPFSMERFSAHLYFYTDALTTIAALAVLIVLYLKINWKYKKIAMVLFVIMLVSFGGIRCYEKINATHALEENLEGNFTQTATYPTSNMFVWQGVLINPKNQKYQLYTYNGLNGKKTFQGNYSGLVIENGTYESGIAAIEKTNQTTDAQRFIWYSYYTCIDAKFENNQWKISYLDFLGSYYTPNNLTIYVDN